MKKIIIGFILILTVVAACVLPDALGLEGLKSILVSLFLSLIGGFIGGYIQATYYGP